MIPRGTTFEFEYLGEFKIEIKIFWSMNQGPYGVDSWKKPEAKNLVLLYL
jgi:hypothetical protein